MKVSRCLLALIAICIAFHAAGCAQEQKKIVVPVAGFTPEMMEQKKAMILKIHQDYPELGQNVLDAFDSIPRLLFVNSAVVHRSYEDKMLPIGSGQTTMKFTDMAYILSQIRIQPSDTVLEIGTGTGYFAMVLSRLCAQVYSIEIIEYLWELAVNNRKLLKIDNVKILNDDGMNGWQDKAPFDVVIITAAVEAIPEPILSQLKPSARLAVPLIQKSGSTVWTIYEYNEGKLLETAHRASKVDPAIITSQPVPQT